MSETLRSRSFQRILLIKPSALGDVVHTVPVLVKLRKRYPKARIDWMLTPHIAELVGRHAALSEVILFDRRGLARLSRPDRVAAGLYRLVRRLRRGRYDLVIDLHGQFRSAFFTLSTGAPTRIGFDRPRKSNCRSERKLPPTAYRHGWTGAREGSWVAYTHRIPIPTLDVHAVDRYLRLGELLGFDDGPADFDLSIAKEVTARVRQMLDEQAIRDRPYAVLAPGTIWETKRWRSEGFAAVAGHFLAKGWAVVLVGAPGERNRCKVVADACPEAVDLSGRTSIAELAAVIDGAAICITNDSGPMHLAVALGRPVVSIFGPTDAVWVGPYGRPQAVVQADLACSPCYFRRLSQCPYDHACMREVSSEQVISHAESALEPIPVGVVARASSP